MRVIIACPRFIRGCEGNQIYYRLLFLFMIARKIDRLTLGYVPVAPVQVLEGHGSVEVV
jgi:hypothetical protein